MSTPAEAAPPRIALLALPETTPATLFCLQETLLAVGRAWEELTSEPTGTPPMEVQVVAADPSGVRLHAGPTIQPDSGLADADADVIIVTDLAFDLAAFGPGRWPVEAAWLQTQYARGVRICSVCTGALILAEAGLLDGETATTHWIAAGLLADCYPSVRVDASQVLAVAGPDGRIITCGGPASWSDLALRLIAEHRGAMEAIRIAKIFLLGDRSAGQSPFAVASKALGHGDAVIHELQVWLADNYMRANPVGRLAGLSGLNPRTLARRFKAATGLAPIDYVQTLRLEEAKQLLETSEAAVDDIPAMVGYEDPAHFRRMFKRRAGVSPSRYRRMFAGVGRGLAADQAAAARQISRAAASSTASESRPRAR